jgi:hypothetical protein
MGRTSGWSRPGRPDVRPGGCEVAVQRAAVLEPTSWSVGFNPAASRRSREHLHVEAQRAVSGRPRAPRLSAAAFCEAAVRRPAAAAECGTDRWRPSPPPAHLCGFGDVAVTTRRHGLPWWRVDDVTDQDRGGLCEGTRRAQRRKQQYGSPELPPADEAQVFQVPLQISERSPRVGNVSDRPSTSQHALSQLV